MKKSLALKVEFHVPNKQPVYVGYQGLYNQMKTTNYFPLFRPTL